MKLAFFLLFFFNRLFGMNKLGYTLGFCLATLVFGKRGCRGLNVERDIKEKTRHEFNDEKEVLLVPLFFLLSLN